MTSRERMLTAIRHEQPDRVPVSPFGLGHLDPKGEAARRLISLTEPFINGPVPGGDPILGTAVEAASQQDGDVTITTYHTPAGDLVRRRRRTTVTSATIEFPLKTAADIEKVLSIPYEPPEPDVAPFLARKAEIGEDAHGGVLFERRRAGAAG